MNLTDWINSTLYPTLFESIDTVFVEHSFKQYAGGWRSATYMNGEKHQRTDKTVITKRKPSRILENGGESLTLIDYVMQRDNITNIEAIKWLASSVGLTVPTDKNFDAGAYEKQRESLELLELCNNYFIDRLHKEEEAKEVLSYLKDRGYTLEDIKEMELGYIPSQMALHNHLREYKYSDTLIREALHLHKDIGVENKLSIPFRTSNKITGFSFRALKEGKGIQKYINSTGLNKGDALFNLSSLKGDKDIVVVEGLLDALIATARGVDNVVALGGVSISPKGIQDALKKGAKSFTLCLDNDEAGTTGVEKTVEALLKEGVNRIYIATLEGTSKLDVDDVIRDKGVEAFKKIISTALPYYSHKLNNIFTKYAKIEEAETRYLTSKEIDRLLEEVVTTATALEPIDRDIFTKEFLKQDFTNALGITEKSIDITVKEITKATEQRDTIRKLKNLSKDINEATAKGDTNRTFDLLKEAQRIEIESKATDLSELYHTITEEELTKSLKDSPESLNSGYTIGVDQYDKKPIPLLLPSGALSAVAGPTAHGKTTFLINLALNVVENHTDKDVYFFSFEEHSNAILMKMLNAYIGKITTSDISRGCRGAIKHYFATKELTYMTGGKEEEFLNLKDKFFKELVSTNRLNVKFASYDCETLVTAIHALKENTNVGAIFIDYIQLINLAPGHGKGSRQQEVKEITEQLKRVSVDTGLPIIVGAQFNREAVNHLTLHPTNIGEAGDIERSANLIIAFWNNEYDAIYPKDKEPKEATALRERGYTEKGTLYATILKNRDGIVGLKEALVWNGNTQAVTNLTPKERAQRAYSRGETIEEVKPSDNPYQKNNIEFKPKVESKLPFEPIK